jgi:hypothetical protein
MYAGSLRLTKANFPFVDKLDFEESSQVLEALQASTSIDVMYDEVETFEYAKTRVDAGEAYEEASHTLYVYPRCEGVLTRPTLFVPELEVWNFPHPIETISFHYTQAQKFGTTGLFPCLRKVNVDYTSKLFKPRITDFSPCKMLTSLTLNIKDPSGTGLSGISKLVNLQSLFVEFYDTPNQRDIYPFEEITKLEKLVALFMCGSQICGCIPKEIHKLKCLTDLKLRNTNLSSSIPSELGQLFNLRRLYLVSNKRLVGGLPKELNNLHSLIQIILEGTPNVVARTVMTHGRWNRDEWQKHW